MSTFGVYLGRGSGLAPGLQTLHIFAFFEAFLALQRAAGDILFRRGGGGWAWSGGGGRALALEGLLEHVQLLVEFGQLLALGRDFAHRVQHRGVVAPAKELADLG